VSAVRLFVLGTLAQQGPMHGHQVRRVAEGRRQDQWAKVQQGAIYGALHRLAADGAVEVVRTERAGNMPARTVYGITEAGVMELSRHRHAALSDAALAPDPVDLALHYTDGMSHQELIDLVEARRASLTAQVTERLRLREQRSHLLPRMGWLTFEHSLIRLRAEIRWHEQLLSELRENPGAGDRPAPALNEEPSDGPTDDPGVDGYRARRR
jgi:DNA-binding PadR family transcriptional regulator